jgi:hypothetical protein
MNRNSSAKKGEGNSYQDKQDGVDFLRESGALAA